MSAVVSRGCCRRGVTWFMKADVWRPRCSAGGCCFGGRAIFPLMKKTRLVVQWSCSTRTSFMQDDKTGPLVVLHADVLHAGRRGGFSLATTVKETGGPARNYARLSSTFLSVEAGQRKPCAPRRRRAPPHPDFSFYINISQICDREKELRGAGTPSSDHSECNVGDFVWLWFSGVLG